MDHEKENSTDPIEEIQSEPSSGDGHRFNSKPKSVHIKTPEVEVRLYQRGRGPVQVFKSRLGGWDQNQLEVGDILEKYGLKSLYAFNPEEGKRAIAIRFNARNGRSILPYTDGSVVHVDGEPKDSMVMPVTKVLLAVTLLTLLVAIYFRETPKWLTSSKLSSLNFPPWVLACIIIAFTRLHKRTKDVLKKFGW